MKHTIIILPLLCIIVFFSNCKPKEPERKRYAIIPVIEYVEYDSFYTTVTPVIIQNGIGAAWYSAKHKKVTSIQHSYDTILIGAKHSSIITSKQ